jgi:hypothetical protein
MTEGNSEIWIDNSTATEIHTYKNNLDHTLALATPTRFLLESGEWNITPTIRNSMAEEMNPFEYNFQERAPIQHPKQDEPNHFNKDATPPYVSQPETVMTSTTSVSPPTPPMSVSQSPDNSSASSPIYNTESQLVQPMESTSPVQSALSQAPSVRRSARAHAKPQLFNDIDEQEKKPSRSVQSGRKRRIVFEGDDAEDRRKKFLERNRVAGKYYKLKGLM